MDDEKLFKIYLIAMLIFTGLMALVPFTMLLLKWLGVI